MTKKELLDLLREAAEDEAVVGLWTIGNVNLPAALLAYFESTPDPWEPWCELAEQHRKTAERLTAGRDTYKRIAERRWEQYTKAWDRAEGWQKLAEGDQRNLKKALERIAELESQLENSVVLPAQWNDGPPMCSVRYTWGVLLRDAQKSADERQSKLVAVMLGLLIDAIGDDA